LGDLVQLTAMSRNFDFSQTPNNGVLVFPDFTATPPQVNDVLSAKTVNPDGSVDLVFVDPLASAGGISEAPQDGYSYGRANAIWWRVLPTSGGNMTGALALASDPTNPMQAATKQYVDNTVVNAPGKFPEAPTDGAIYGRGGATPAWYPTLPLSGGTLTGNLTLAADPVTPLGAATRQYVLNAVATAPFLPVAGGTLTGALVLAADPAANMQPVTLQYYNAHLPVPPQPSNATPLMNGTAAPGTGTQWSRTDHVHPTDTSLLTPVQADQRYLNLTGGTLTGPLTLYQDPTSAPEAATKNYVDTHAGAVTISDTAPAAPRNGALWFDSIGAQTYLWFTDPTSSQWVPVNAPPASTTAFLPLSGGSLSGPLTLVGNAVSALQAVPLQQVPAASSTTPAMDSTAAVGTGATWARADHVHPSDTSRMTQAQADGRYLALTGGSLSGVVASTTNIAALNFIVQGAGGAVYYAASTNNFYTFITAGGDRFTNFSTAGWAWIWQSSTGNLIFQDNASHALSFTTGLGDFHVMGNVVAANVSDARTKKNRRPYTRGLADLVQLKPEAWEYNGEGFTNDDGTTHYGCTAQDAQPYIPECVYPTPEGPVVDHTKDNWKPARLPGQLSLDPAPLTFALINAVTELAARVAALEARV
jgi:hypothetical protein